MSDTSLDLDWQIRTAAFDTVRRATAASGGVMKREQMKQGFQFEGERIPLAHRPRGIWKPGRLGRDGAALSISTVPFGPYDDQVATDGWFEYRYQGKDPNAADNRAV